MQNDIAIRVSNVSKKYLIGKQKDSSLRGSLQSVLNRKSSQGDEFMALSDLNFEIKKGEVLGIIGKNGAGKSTLLKILSQITKPTTGRIEINGRVASLLEVGTGFHPELTGRENIYLNGTILGMSRKEVSSKFDEIVEFSGVEKFIDTPVKHYSSGMYVRLAFAVAAHLEPEILIIDEVLAVGDAEFQKKCLGKMKDVASEGRTVIFVSHDLIAMKNICKKAYLFKEGNLIFQGEINDVIHEYLQDKDSLNHMKISERTDRLGFGNLKITNLKIIDSEKIKTNNSIEIIIEYKSINKLEINEFGVSVWDSKENRIISISTTFKNQIKKFKSNGALSCVIHEIPLIHGDYILNCFISSIFGIEDYIENAVIFSIRENDVFGTGKTINPEWGVVVVNHDWKIIE